MTDLRRQASRRHFWVENELTDAFVADINDPDLVKDQPKTLLEARQICSEVSSSFSLMKDEPKTKDDAFLAKCK